MSTITYSNRPLNAKFAERIGKTGYVAYLNTGETIDAYQKILAKSIAKCGVTMTVGIAREVISQFLADINDSIKENGCPHQVGDVVRFDVRQRSGLLPAAASRISKSDLRIAASFLKGKPDFEFDLRNIVDGIDIQLYTATGVSQGRDVNTFVAGENVRLNGKNVIIGEGDFVEVAATVNGTDYSARCTVVESDRDYIIVTPPAAVGAFPAGTVVTFIANTKGGDPDGGVQTVSQKATLAAYDGTIPLIMAFNQGDLEEGTFHCNASEWVTLKGAGFRSLNIQSLKVGHRSGNTYDKQINATEVSIVDDNTMRFKLPTNTSTMTDEELREADLSVTLYTQSAISAAYSLTYVG